MSPSISVVPFAREPKRIALWEIDLSRVCLFRLSVNPFAQLTRLFPHSISISDALFVVRILPIKIYLQTLYFQILNTL